MQLDAPEDGSDEEGGSSRGVDAVKLLSAVLADSPSNRQAMLQMAGARVAVSYAEFAGSQILLQR